MSDLTQSPAWLALVEHQKAMADVHMRTLFADDPERFDRYTLEVGDLFIDTSKNRITDATIDKLLALADQQGVSDAIANIVAAMNRPFVV